MIENDIIGMCVGDVENRDECRFKTKLTDSNFICNRQKLRVYFVITTVTHQIIDNINMSII
jgi:hypothetical protein